MMRHRPSRRSSARKPALESLEGRRLLAAPGSLAVAQQYDPSKGPYAQFTVFDRTVAESDGVLSIAVARTGDVSAAATISVRAVGTTALEGYDFLGLDQTVSFAPGQAEATFQLTIVDDDAAEPIAKQLLLELYQADGDALHATSYLTVWIEDDEPASASPLAFHAFGAAGLWTYNEVDGYRKINDVSPEAIFAAPDRGAYLDFGPAGLWAWDELRGYRKLSDADPRAILTNAGAEELLVDFGHGGVWSWSASDGYAKINDVSPRAMSGYSTSAVFDYADQGLWTWNDLGGWAKVRDEGPEAMQEAEGLYYLDYGAGGLWRMNPGGQLEQVNGGDAESMAAVASGIVVDFGAAGLWKLGDSDSWIKLSDLSPASIASSGDALYLDFGGAGFWRLGPDETWSKLNDLAPRAIAFPSADAPHLDYGDAGLWAWSATSGWTKLNDARATALGRAWPYPAFRYTPGPMA